MKRKTPIIKAWEVVTCKHGHPCYIVTRPIYDDTTDCSNAAISLGDTKGQHAEECPICHTEIWEREENTYKMILHVKGKPRKGLSSKGKGFVY